MNGTNDSFGKKNVALHVFDQDSMGAFGTATFPHQKTKTTLNYDAF